MSTEKKYFVSLDDTEMNILDEALHQMAMFYQREVLKAEDEERDATEDKLVCENTYALLRKLNWIYWTK